MLDFLMISTRNKRHGVVEIYPKFIVKKSKDLMIRGGDFYAIWLEHENRWSTNEEDVIDIIDALLEKFVKDNKHRLGNDYVEIMYMWDSLSGSIDSWHKYCQKQLRDNYIPLDDSLIFLNQETTKEDYSSKRLNYSLDENGSTDSYMELVSTLYSDDERHKLEWCIGAVVTGASKYLQKFAVLYGPPGSGKSTILNIIEMLFDGYHAGFDAESLGSNDAFSLEQFKRNPLVAISHDGDLSKVEKNTRINSLVSHESMVVNEKNRPRYNMRFSSFLFIGTNKPVRITDAKSGLIRRLIDIHPSGERLSVTRYNRLTKLISFELGAIAAHCKAVYLDDPSAYDDYIPKDMMGESNNFYNFMLDSYQIFKKDDGVSLKQAWEMYKIYCDQAKVPYPLQMMIFKIELKSYFREYDERIKTAEGYIRSYYSGFKTETFDIQEEVKPRYRKKLNKPVSANVDFQEQPSKLDIFCSDCPAQYGYETGRGAPQQKWADVTTTLSDLDTSKLHYLKVPDNLIVIDFDITDDDGNKSLEKNLEEASKWPKTYSELSKSGQGIHLHYIYNGDPTQLSRVYANSIEIKVFTGNSSLRRMVTRCNNEDIATISSGLPMKEGGKVVNFETITNERALRTIIKKNLNKEYHGSTKPSMDFIFKVLEDAYTSGMKYDVGDLHGAILAFASSSSNQSDYCVRLIPKMKFKSDESSDSVTLDREIIFFDFEVFPNVVFLNWKFKGKGKTMNRLINPKPSDVEKILKYRLVGFNNRRYDNHIMYAIFIGYSNAQIYDLSSRLVSNDRRALFGEAYNLSYTDIYDYATTKQSLKKWQIELKIKHLELGLPWDQPLDEKLWPKVSRYCDNDVESTEALWEHTQGDFRAREILAELAGATVNDTTNSLTTKIIFGREKNPKLNYTDLSEEFPGYEFVKVWNPDTKKYDKFNMFRGEDMGFGGRVKASPGMYRKVGLLDIVSMHPTTIDVLNYLGEYAPIFKAIVDARVYIKHGQIDKAKLLFDGRLARYLEHPEEMEALAGALKIAINSVYGLTSAKFSNEFQIKENENNIVALRGALFMKTLEDELDKMGYSVIHTKTDSIKIPNITNEIISFCNGFARKYGYTFEHEATYEKIALVNDAVYIAKYDENGIRTKKGRDAGKWTATGLQFSIPYVFKTIFSKETIIFDDFCEVKEVKKSAIYLKFGETEDYTEETLRFVGRVGQFTPVKDGGGYLVRPMEKKDGTIGYDSIIGSKGYLWLESAEVAEKLGSQPTWNDITKIVDLSYYNKLVDNAIEDLNKYGDVEWFIS